MDVDTLIRSALTLPGERWLTRSSTQVADDDVVERAALAASGAGGARGERANEGPGPLVVDITRTGERHGGALVGLG
jgi:hypothetical protein